VVRWGFVLGACLLAGCAPTKPWTRSAKAMLGLNVACNTLDYAQTDWAMEHGYTEGNPVLGESPSDGRILATKVATQALIYRLADGTENRTLTLALALAPCLAVVAHNYSEGARP
jgi:hypothetical protein